LTANLPLLGDSATKYNKAFNLVSKPTAALPAIFYSLILHATKGVDKKISRGRANKKDRKIVKKIEKLHYYASSRGGVGGPTEKKTKK